MNLDLTAINFARLSLDQTQRFASRDERNYSVVMCLQPLSQFSNGCPIAVRVALDMQQQQILQWSNAFVLSGLLGESLEPPHLITKLGQLFKVFFSQCAKGFFHRDSPVRILDHNCITR